MLIDEQSGTVRLRHQHIGAIDMPPPPAAPSCSWYHSATSIAKAPQLMKSPHCACFNSSTSSSVFIVLGSAATGVSRPAVRIWLMLQVNSHLDNRGYSLHSWGGLSCCGPPLVRGRPCAPQQVQVRPLNSEPPGAHARPLTICSLQAGATNFAGRLQNKACGCCKLTCSRLHWLCCTCKTAGMAASHSQSKRV